MQVEETDSLEHHETRARAYCESKGWKVAKVYALEGISGKSVLETPQAKEMLADIKAGNISTLIFSSLSRLARNTKELLLISEIFQKHNASLVSLKESIDTDSPAGRLFFTVLSALATFEAEEISARVKASVPIRAKLGKSLGGALPFGYTRDKEGKIILDPKEAPIRKEMFTIFLECRKKKTTARIMNERGYRTRKGGIFRDNSITHLLTDPMAKGLRRTNYTRSTGSGKHWELKDESEWVHTKVPAIVDEEIFDKVQNILMVQQSSRKKPTRQAVHPFAGLVYCSCKDIKMVVKSSNPSKYTCPECKAKIPKDDLEHIYKEQLKNFILSPERMEKYLSKANVVIDDKEKQLKILKDEQVATNNKSQKFLDLYTNNDISREGFTRSNKPLDKRLNELEESIPKLEAEISLLKSQMMDEAELNHSSANLYQKWSSFSEEDKVSIIKNLTDKITVNKNEVEIKLHFLPSAINNYKQATKETIKKVNAKQKGQATNLSASQSNNGILAQNQQGFCAAMS
jgi:site-specific DNA recombinase